MTREAITRWAAERRERYVSSKRRAKAMTWTGGTWVALALFLPIVLFNPDGANLLPYGLICVPVGLGLLLAGMASDERIPYVPPVEDQIDLYCRDDSMMLLRASDTPEDHLLRAFGGR